MRSRAGPGLADRWAIPRSVLAKSAVFVAVLLVPIGTVGVLAGQGAVLPMLMAVIMCLPAASRLPPRYALLLVPLVAATAAVAVAVTGQPFVAACFALLVCLLIAPANTLDNGLLAAVPAIASVYLGEPALALEPVPTALWTLVGGLLIVLLMAIGSSPAPLTGISAATAYRHAATMAVAVGVAVFVVLEFDVPHGYWVPMTMALVLQPFAAETRGRAGQRIWGTVGGALLALLMALTLPPWAIAIAILPLSLLNVAYSLLDRYGQAVVFLTPGAVLLADLAYREAEITATIARLIATLVGALIAVGLALFLQRADGRTPVSVPGTGGHPV